MFVATAISDLTPSPSFRGPERWACLLAIAMTGMIQDGVWDAFPKLRVGFMEGGTGWIPMIIDRLEREHEYGELVCQRAVLEYFTSGNFYVGCEGNERALASVVNLIGPQR